jgi:signal transduction histidine kinase/ActR/RegA family two-component response regulator
MSVDPQVIRSEPHTEIGNLLRSNVGIIIDRWSRRAVEEHPNASRVHHAVLVDHLQELLSMLGRSLAASYDPDIGEHCISATKHGEQRWEAGWSLIEVVRDYQILRFVVLEFLEESLDRPLGYREVLAIGLALDEAIAASVAMYVHGREHYLRQLEEQRTQEHEQAQQRLKAQAAALEDADRRKNEFLAVLAHELRNPLAPIRNAIEILRLEDLADPSVRWARELIERQVHQLSHMVDDLLDISRIALGKIRLQKENVALKSVVDRAIETTQPFIDAREDSLTVSMPPDPVWLEADAARLTQVLVNLLTNAVKYSDERSQIWLSVRREPEEVVITVRDTGIGIRPELLTRVFDPFVQDDRLAERAPGGLGIGLSLVRSLIDLHGGRVRAFSDGPGQGSKFVVHLPLAKGAPPPTSSNRRTSGTSGNGPAQRILIVDDNADSADSLARLLRVLGHDVQTANDGPAALEAARTRPPGIVLLDIGLPGMDGLEVARRMRQELGLSRAVLVALTGYGQEDDKRRSQDAGFDAHFVKPVDLAALQALLARAEAPDAGGKSSAT